MIKLIEAYNANPTEKNMAKIKAYLNKHPMSAMMLPADFKIL